jgi:hypothetical protein
MKAKVFLSCLVFAFITGCTTNVSTKQLSPQEQVQSSTELRPPGNIVIKECIALSDANYPMNVVVNIEPFGGDFWKAYKYEQKMPSLERFAKKQKVTGRDIGQHGFIGAHIQKSASERAEREMYRKMDDMGEEVQRVIEDEVTGKYQELGKNTAVKLSEQFCNFLRQKNLFHQIEMAETSHKKDILVLRGELSQFHVKFTQEWNMSENGLIGSKYSTQCFLELTMRAVNHKEDILAVYRAEKISEPLTFEEKGIPGEVPIHPMDIARKSDLQYSKMLSEAFEEITVHLINDINSGILPGK